MSPVFFGHDIVVTNFNAVLSRDLFSRSLLSQDNSNDIGELLRSLKLHLWLSFFLRLYPTNHKPNQ